VGGIAELGIDVDDSLFPLRMTVDYVRVERGNP
jgi:hypothetical protein